MNWKRFAFPLQIHANIDNSTNNTAQTNKQTKSHSQPHSSDSKNSSAHPVLACHANTVWTSLSNPSAEIHFLINETYGGRTMCCTCLFFFFLFFFTRAFTNWINHLPNQMCTPMVFRLEWAMHDLYPGCLTLGMYNCPSHYKWHCEWSMYDDCRGSVQSEWEMQRMRKKSKKDTWNLYRTNKKYTRWYETKIPNNNNNNQQKSIPPKRDGDLDEWVFHGIW